ncbi:MAG TPA: hypothetical protein VGN86_17900 [Pyrinomonadaceae bacterium]|jgi:hypothetical protein|nr:hypothetical protein [Pyrinomonadaceae bacterium]
MNKRKPPVGDECLLPWLLGLLLLPLLIAGCDSGCPEWSQVRKNQPEGAPTPTTTLVKTTNELIVYLDTSGSMAGYRSKDGQSTFEKTLRELRTASGTFGNSDVRVMVRHVGKVVGPPLTDTELTTGSWESIYHDHETNLAGAIASFRTPTQQILRTAVAVKKIKATIASDNPAAAPGDPEPAPPARFHILVTDGVQSAKKGSAPQDCSAGSDQFCVRQSIGELLREGWGGCVLGIRADFHGKVYSETSGAAIPYDSKSNDPATLRPFYLYIFSPDQAALEPLVKLLKERLRPLTTSEESIRELNLSFPYVEKFAGFEVTVPPESRSAIKRSRDRGGPPERYTLHVDVDSEHSGPKPFSIKATIPWSAHAKDTGSAAQLMRLVRWNIVPVYPAELVKGERFPEVKVVGSPEFDPSEGEGRIVLQVTAGFPSGTERPSCRIYRLEGRLDLNQATPEWIRSWSSDLDTDQKTGNRTFNLETALLGLWNNSSVKDQLLAEVYLRVGP